RKAPWTTLPVWTERHVSFGRALARARIGADADARLEAYVASAFPLRRAAALLETLVDELPGFAGRDRALFALGHCRADLLDDWPTKGIGTWGDVWIHPGPRPADGAGALEHGH